MEDFLVQHAVFLAWSEKIMEEHVIVMGNKEEIMSMIANVVPQTNSEYI